MKAKMDNEGDATGNETISRYYTYDSRFPDLVRRIEYDNDDYVSYTYDRFGRLSRSDRQAGSTTLSDAYSYTAGLLMSHKHIVSGVCKTEETFTYDNFGHLVKSGISPSTTVWELLEVNPRGQVVQEKKGNIVTTYTYDDAGRILNISAPGIVDLSYTYDYAGNVLTKTDDITNQRASYTYDGKRRLTSWRTECPYLDSDPVADLSLRSAPLLVDVTHTITYDGSTGNITSKSDIGTNTSFTYNPQDKPHALRSVSGVTANWGTNTASIGYNDYGQLETIEQDNTTYSIQYSPDGRRIKSDLREGNSTFTVRYYGNGIEKAYSGSDDIDYLTYLCSGAIVVHHEGSGGALRAAPPSTPTAILQGYYDAQGSLIALVNGNGTVARRYAYDPWGKRVNPTNWTQPDTSADIYHINRGYTMHEHLDDFGLINMNGRVFDPSVAQFLSPDNYIQSDGNWLNYNRYAYCYNNPINYTDPSGEIVGTLLTFGCDLIHSVGKSVCLAFCGDWDAIGDTWKEFDPANPSSRTAKAWKIDMGLWQTDESLSKKEQIGQLWNRFTWELPQTLLGYIVMTGYNIEGHVDRVDYFGGATFCINENSYDSRNLSLGCYIHVYDFHSVDESFSDYICKHPTYMHEYGHYLESQRLGVAYLPGIALPSLFSQIAEDVTYIDKQKPAPKHFHNHSYFYSERWANTLAADYFSRYGVDWDKMHYYSNGTKYYYNTQYPTY